MNRRGHLSTKIPNVKLRPAPAASTSASTSRGKQREPSPMNAMDTEIMRQAWAGAEDDETSTAALRIVEKPWRDVVITLTGVENKAYLTGLAKEIGALVESALTVTVTHVVASGFGSAKYLYAVEHRLPVMAPSWIQNSHAKWLKGEELDLASEAETHKLKPFVGLRIAISGIEALDRRRQIVHHISHNGGVYSKDLDRKCTHLVSAKSTGDSQSSEKVKWAVKEISERDTKRRSGKRVDGEDIRIVYEEWIWDCVGFEGRWMANAYDARKQRPVGRVSAEDVLNGTVRHDEKKLPKEVRAEAPENTEPAVLRKRKREAMDLVDDIISTTTVKVEIRQEPAGKEASSATVANAAGPLTIAKDAKPELALPDLVEETKPRRPEEESSRKPSMLHSSRATSFTKHEPSIPHPVPLHSATTPSLPPSIPHSAVVKVVKPEAGPSTSAFFAGLRFSHNIAEQCDGLEKALVTHGGTLVTEADRLEGTAVDFVVVRLCSAVKPTLLSGIPQSRVVTECWVEGCCFEQRMLCPDDHLVFQPLPAPMPITGTSTFQVHLSGFSTGDMVYLKRLLRAMGGTLSLKLNRQTTHLVCAAPTGQKYEKSLEWGISVVQDTWLFAMGRSGRIEPEADHRHSLTLPATGRSGQKLTGKTGCTSNMSMVSDLSHPVDFARIKSALVLPGTSSSAPPKPLSQQSISPSRKLQLTPTHIDGASFSGSAVLARGSVGHALSPPEPETERLLNQASPQSIDSRFARTTSAPPALSPRSREKRETPLFKAATMSSGVGRKEDMTEVLRQLAQTDQTTPGSRARIQRRNRPPSRHRTSVPGYFPLMTSLSPVSRLGSPPSSHELDAPGIPDHEMGLEDSLRVDYVDPVSVREHRRLLEAVRKGPVSDDVEGPSPVKKVRGRR